MKKPVIINENQATETELKKQPKKSVLDKFRPVSMPTELILEKNSDPKVVEEVVESQRRGLFDLYRRTKKISSILMVAVVIVFIAAFLLMTYTSVGVAIGWSLISLMLVGMVVFFVLTKNLYPNASKKYFASFWKAENDYLFSASEFSDCKIDTNEKYVLADVVSDRCYKNVIDIASRNIVHGLYKQKGFTFGELAFYKPGIRKNSREVVFVGRHLAFANDLHFEGRYIINIKGEKEFDLPTDIEDLKVLVEHNKFIVYGSEDANPVKDLGSDLLNDLKAIECVGALLNVCVVIWAGHTSVYLSYDDSIVSIPFEKPINIQSYEQLKRNVMNVFEILEK